MDLSTQTCGIKDLKRKDKEDTAEEMETSGDGRIKTVTLTPKKQPVSDNGAPKQEEYDTFQSWALGNYGETSKTKTVTRRKYNRIKRTLTGDEVPCSENAKFRFWVKAKGFKLGPSSWRTGDPDTTQVLYVPTKVQTPHGTIKEFKRVAIVDDFYDIIYSMHVDPESRGGKHAGQKRTYRAIAETYAFLPREAVTRFLMSCSDCQKRMHLSPEHLSHPDKSSTSPSSSQGPGDAEIEEDSNSVGDADLNASLLNFNIPITTTYLNHIKKKKLNLEENDQGIVQDVSSSVEEELIDLSPKRGDNEIIEDSTRNMKVQPQKKSYNTSPVSLLRQCNSPTSKHGKYVNKLKPQVGSLRRAQNNSLPSESSVSPRAANLYKPYETKMHRPTDMSKTRSNIFALSPQPASTAGNTSTQGSTEVVHYAGCPSNLLYVNTDSEQTQFTGYNTIADDQSPRVKMEDTNNEPTNLSMKKKDRETGTATYSYMNRYISGPKTGFTDQDQLNMKLLTMKQLILGYRESAAFLYRSAQELEQLLLKYT